MKQYLLISVGMLLAFGCQKTEVIEPDVTEGDPVFYCKGAVDNIPFNITCGMDNYYMYSWYAQDTSGMYSYIAALKQVGCSTNCNSISFQLNDSKKSLKGSSCNIDSLLPGVYNYFADTVVTQPSIQFYSGFTATSTPIQFGWSFGDGTFSKLASPIHTYAIPGIYTVCLNITFANGCWSSLCNDVKAITVNDCQANFNILERGDSVIFMPTVSGNSSTSIFNWDFGDTLSINNTSILKEPYHIFSSPKIYKVRLEAVNKDNCTTVVSKNIKAPKFLVDCVTDYSYSKIVPVVSHFSEITVTYRDKDDQLYTSNIKQPSDSYFEVLSIDEYMLNENNRRTKKVHARFKCNVSNGSKVITITDADAVIALAYPN